MEEFKQTRCLGRLAILAAVSCFGTAVQATEGVNRTSSSFQSLIAQGWRNDSPTTEQVTQVGEAVQEAIGPERPVSPEQPVVPEQLVVSEQPVVSGQPVVQERPIPQEVPRPLAAEKPLAELIRSQPKQIVVPKLIPLGDVHPEAPIRLESRQQANSSIDNAQMIRLHQSARQSLRNAQQRLRRRATHSARMYALETLRSIAAMQDAQQGGNRHGKKLDAALNAIRESRDFGNSFGAIDNKALKQMVAVHETPTLKDQHLDNVSSIEATEAYLNFAQENLVLATGRRREASDALVILGMVQRTTASMDNAHASAVAVTMQRAAVQIAPGNMIAHRELGTTLSRQGLVDQATRSLRRSLAIQPTRSGYQRLLELSRQSGDIDTVQVCLAALKNDNLPSEIPVRTVSPKRFAATHRPSPALIQRTKSETTVVKSSSESAGSKPVRVSFRSMLPFRRK